MRLSRAARAGASGWVMTGGLALTAACGRISLGSQESLGEGSSGGSAATAGAASSGAGGAAGVGSATGNGGATSSGGSSLGGGGLALGVGGSSLGVGGWLLDAGADGAPPSGPEDAGGPLDASPVDDLPPSCAATRPLCGEDDTIASCCEALPVPGGFFSLTVDNGRTIPASVRSFRLDRFEVTVGRMRAFIGNYDAWRALGQPVVGLGAHPIIADSGWQERFTEQLPETADAFEAGLRDCGDIPFSTYANGLTEAVPLNCASWFEAAAFCAWDGGRLPTFAELAYAGVGGDHNRVYPWGDTPVPRRELALFGCRLDHLSPICSVDDVAPAGAHPLGAGRFGQHDLAGSMSERVLDGMPAFGESCNDCASLLDESVRMWRGGNWLDGADGMKNGHFSTSDPGLRLQFIGFRCARDE